MPSRETLLASGLVFASLIGAPRAHAVEIDCARGDTSCKVQVHREHEAAFRRFYEARRDRPSARALTHATVLLVRRADRQLVASTVDRRTDPMITESVRYLSGSGQTVFELAVDAETEDAVAERRAHAESAIREYLMEKGFVAAGGTELGALTHVALEAHAKGMSLRFGHGGKTHTWHLDDAGAAAAFAKPCPASAAIVRAAATEAWIAVQFARPGLQVDWEGSHEACASVLSVVEITLSGAQIQVSSGAKAWRRVGG